MYSVTHQASFQPSHEEGERAGGEDSITAFSGSLVFPVEFAAIRGSQVHRVTDSSAAYGF